MVCIYLLGHTRNCGDNVRRKDESYLKFFIIFPFILLAEFLLNICVEKPLVNYWRNKKRKLYE